MRRPASSTALLIALCLTALPAAAAQPAPKAAPKPATATPAPKPAPPKNDFAGGKGKVLEAKTYKNYTYLRVKVGKSELWVAGPQVAAKKGDTVLLAPGMVMTNFWSDAYQRSFDRIYFLPSIEVAGAKKPEAAAAAAPQAAPASLPTGPVARAEGGKTVEEVFLEKTELKGKEVVVRARVLKTASAILGKNWLHLADGTGGPGSNDLVVTTQAEAAPGDVVLVKGKVTLDRDFGSGYRYDVILEDAAVTRE